MGKVKIKEYIPLNWNKEELEEYKKALLTRLKGINRLQKKLEQNTPYQKKFYEVSEKNKQKLENQLKEIDERLYNLCN